MKKLEKKGGMPEVKKVTDEDLKRVLVALEGSFERGNIFELTDLKGKNMEQLPLIIVGYSDRKRIREVFNVSYPTVKWALDGKCKSKLSLKIRQYAKQNGGQEVQPLTTQNK